MFSPVYFDHNATTPLHPAVLAAMLPWLESRFGNPSSRHEYGRAARRAIDEAREQVAVAVGAHPTEVVFVGSGSEANNLAIKGCAAVMNPGVLAVSAIEHPCVRRPAEQLARRGWQLRLLKVDAEGRVDPDDYGSAMNGRPGLVSVMLANNETGVLQDIYELAARARAAGAVFHTDAVQAVGKIGVDFRALNAAGVQAMTVSAHKIGGPKGTAALILDKRVEVSPLISGGGQERGLRSGTENVASLVGFGAACVRAVEALEEASGGLLAMRGRLESGLAALGAQIFSAGASRLPNTVLFSLPDIDGETLVAQMDRAGFALASGAACSSANPEPSPVLLAMGVSPQTARGAVRISLGCGNKAREVDDFLLTLRATVEKLQRLTAMAV